MKTPSLFHHVTLDGCYDHHAGIADKNVHRHAAESIAPADALLFGRVTYEMMECGFRVVGRSELDDQGQPHPLLHLRTVAEHGTL